MSTTSILVIDVGTSGLRAAVVDADAAIIAVRHRRTPPMIPFPGLVEFDAVTLASEAIEVAAEVLELAGPVAALGIATQRASTLVWDRATGEPVGPGLGWQDLRTVGDCLTLRAEHGLTLAPNQSATKLAHLLDLHDPERRRDLCFGTVDSWLIWNLTEGREHVTDPTNAAVTGLLLPDGTGWNERVLDLLRIPPATLPRIVDSMGIVAPATVLTGAPLIAGIAGDQQASLIGQGCVRPGSAKITFGTGGMLDICTGETAPQSAARLPAGTFPIVAWGSAGERVWGAEAIMLSAGSNVDWLVEDLGVLATPAESHEVAASVASTDGVVYVPALLGLGTPHWDYGARGTLLGVTRGTTRAHLVRAVLEGVAHRGADLVDAAQADTGLEIASLRVDGGMSANPTFVQALADATGRPVEVSPISEATTLGAAYLAGVTVGTWVDLEDTATRWAPSRRIEPSLPSDRERWHRAVERSRAWIPELSALDF